MDAATRQLLTDLIDYLVDCRVSIDAYDSGVADPSKLIERAEAALAATEGN